MRLATEKLALVDALCSMSKLGRRQAARRFLEGLSHDELQYIAAYLGALLLEPELELSDSSRNHIARQIASYEWNRSRNGSPGRLFRNECTTKLSTVSDVAHKMILLLEYLSMSRLEHRATAWSVEGGSA